MKTKNKLKSLKTGKVSNDDPLARPMIPLEKCKAIMNRGGLTYTDEELLAIRDFMYRLAEIMTTYYERVQEKRAKIISINKDNNNDKTESIPLRSGEYGRTG